MFSIFSGYKGSIISKIVHWSSLAVFLAAVLWILAVSGVKTVWKNRIFPGMTISNIPVGSLSFFQASSLVKSQADIFTQRPIILSFEEHKYEIHPQDIGLDFDVEGSIDKAKSFGRGSLLEILPAFIKGASQGESFTVDYSLDQGALEASLSAIEAEIEKPRLPPTIKVLEQPDPSTGSRIKLVLGEDGRKVEHERLFFEIKGNIESLENPPITIPVQILASSESAIDQVLTKERAEAFLDKTIILTYGDFQDQTNEVKVSGEELVRFLDFSGNFKRQKITSYLETLAEGIDRPYENAQFEFKNGRVVEFSPEKEGLELKVEEAKDRMLKAISRLETGEETEIGVELPLAKTPAAITVADVNNLGIKELLGRGVSTFHGSIANREYNISLASSRIAGFLVPPGDTFSFNRAVGDISAATGYRQSYIIKDGRTVLDDGGGVCQVSTTVFRAALDAGLPIVERYAHSYRVTYYEQNSDPGYDATVFAPSVDLKFLNDTPAHILVQTSADTRTNRLQVEIYGTADGREAAAFNHRVWDIAPPPPDLYQDDPTLPAGVVKQVDWKAWGAKVKFDYQVKKGGEIIYEKTFYSNFRPWQSVFLRGTGM